MNSAVQPKIVFVETDPTRRDCLRLLIAKWGYIPISFEKETACLDNVLPLKPSLIISNSLAPEKTFRFINTVKAIDLRLPVLVMSDDVEVQTFIEGNNFYNIRILGTDTRSEEIKRMIESMLADRSKRKQRPSCPLIIGQHREIVKIKQMIGELTHTREAILIKGGPGTGKEHVARVLHRSSNRRNGPFIKVNAAELTRDSLQNELLGNIYSTRLEIGIGTKIRFGDKRRGTLFLKAIDKIPAALQGNVLYFLEADTDIGPSSEKARNTEVRIIASTHEDIDRLVATDRFRKDLYFRLSTITMEIPLLKDRCKDIPLLADYFSDKFCLQFGRSCQGLSDKAKAILKLYSWPGNVEELQSVIRNIVLKGSEEELIAMDRLYQGESHGAIDDYLDVYSLQLFFNEKKFMSHLNKVSLKEIGKEYIARAERIVMRRALERANWNRKKAASELNISYKSLLNKIRVYDLA